MKKEMNMDSLQANLRMLNKKSEMAFEQAKAVGKTTPEQEKADALLNDEAFLEKFLAAETAEEAQDLFRENGLEISLEELNGLAKYIAEVSKKLIDNGGEISEEELTSARKSLISSWQSIYDDELAMINWYSSQTVWDKFISPEDCVENCKGLTVADISEVAATLKLHTVYFLNGTLKGESEDDDYE